jgi:hypothetical protein
MSEVYVVRTWLRDGSENAMEVRSAAWSLLCFARKDDSRPPTTLAEIADQLLRGRTLRTDHAAFRVVRTEEATTNGTADLATALRSRGHKTKRQTK